MRLNAMSPRSVQRDDLESGRNRIGHLQPTRHPQRGIASHAIDEFRTRDTRGACCRSSPCFA